MPPMKKNTTAATKNTAGLQKISQFELAQKSLDKTAADYSMISGIEESVSTTSSIPQKVSQSGPQKDVKKTSQVTNNGRAKSAKSTVVTKTQKKDAVTAESNESPTKRICCLKSCLENPSTRLITDTDGRVDVRSFEPKSKNKNIMLVDWKAAGEATFHRKCWTALLAATKGFQGGDLEMTDLERSMVLEAKKTAEIHDSDKTLNTEAAHIAHVLKTCPYAIVFTGAGISTAAGIGDFRGISGKWTEREKQKNYGANAGKTKKGGHVLEKLRPTYTHEAIVKLMEMGLIKYVISQNTDGMHRLSGIPADKISELHGNSFIEKCESCDARYERPFACRTNKEPHPPLPCKRCKINHRTGRRCTREGCDSYLMNTIINFGDYLESDVLSDAQLHACRAYTVLALGSTLRVSPANDLVTIGQEPHRLVICNRQSTPYDSDCEEEGPDGQKLGSRVFGDCDRLMREVMGRLLGQREREEWEAGREARLAEYALRRTAVV